MQASDNQRLIQSKFKQAQLSLGLRKQFFDAKFVYSQQQISNPSAFLIPLSKQLPSQRHGFNYTDIQYIHAFGCQIIHESAKCLGLPICTSILAQLLFHFFYARKSFLEYDIRDIMIGSIYLACKSQQTLRKSYQITLAFDFIFKAYEGQKKVQAMEIGSQQYEFIKNKTLRKAQIDILFQLGFQVYKLIDIPHRYISNVLSLFEKHPKYTLICQKTWKRLNDCYKTLSCLYYPHNLIAAAAIYMSLRENEATFPQVPWWTLMESYEQAILNIQVFVLNLQANRKKVSFPYITSKINEVGQKCDLINVFPVPYYRKIMLENKGKCRLSKIRESQEPMDEKRQKKSGTKWGENHENQVMQQNFGDRKIYKIVKDLQQIKKAQTQNNHQKPTKKAASQSKKPIIDTKNLLANISQTLQKHQAVLIKKNQQQMIQQKNQIKQKKQDTPQDSQQEQLKAIAQLRKKVMLNKQTNKDVYSKK